MDVANTARRAVEDLRALLPEACVVWLLRAEPGLLLGVPKRKLEEVSTNEYQRLTTKREAAGHTFLRIESTQFPCSLVCCTQSVLNEARVGRLPMSEGS